jgi:hypothetical protein
MTQQCALTFLLLGTLACSRADKSELQALGITDSTAVRIARSFFSHETDTTGVRLDSVMVKQDSLEWQVYFFRTDRRIPGFELVAVNRQSGVARRVALR